MSLLAKSPILFIHLLCWTLVFADFTFDGEKVPTQWRDRPFILWPAQDREIIILHKCVEEGKRRRCVKSREMGWSWLETVYDLWMFCMKPQSRVLVASRKAEEVYNRSSQPGADPDAIFTKYKYNLDRFPNWIVPGGWEMTNMLLSNLGNGATISGESTNENIGRSGRSDRAWVDEAAFVPNLEEVERAVGENTTSLSLISTPQVGSKFGELGASAAYVQCSMWWFEHPGKSLGLREDPKAHGRIKVTSPWKEKQETKGRKYVAVEIEGDESAAGDMLFDNRMLAEHKARNCRDPVICGDLVFATKRGESGQSINPTVEPEELYEADDKLRHRDGRAVRFESNPGGAWAIWCPLEPDRSTGIPRPPQNSVYVLGCDPGDGRLGANSALVVCDAWSGEQVASFLSARYSSRDLGRIIAAASLWFGGRRPMLIGWETNGVGGGVTEILSQHLRVHGLYRKRVLGKTNNPETDNLGWSSTAPKKRYLLDELQGAMSSGELKLRDGRIVDEARMFVIVAGGWVAQGTRADMQTSAREAHGDMTIAAAIANLMVQELPEQQILDEEMAAARLDVRTWAGREHERIEAEHEAGLPRWRR